MTRSAVFLATLQERREPLVFFDEHEVPFFFQDTARFPQTPTNLKDWVLILKLPITDRAREAAEEVVLGLLQDDAQYGFGVLPNGELGVFMKRLPLTGIPRN